MMLTNAALDETYQDLEAEHQDIYRVLGLLPVTDIDPDMVAVVCRTSHGHAEWGLEILDEQQLLEPLPQRGSRVRYRLLPVAREHARALAVRHDPDPDRRLVLRRFCEWILAISTHAQFRLTPAQATLRRSMTVAAPAVAAPFDDDTGALAWLESLEVSLLDVLDAAEAAGWDDLVWQLVDSFWPLFLRRHPYELWIAAHEIGLEAARRTGDTAAVRQMLASGAIGLSSARRLDEAIDWYGQALDAARDQHDARDEGQALLGLGACHHDAGRPDQARPLLAQAITLWEQCRYPRGVALATIVVGEIALADEPRRALDLFDRARTMLLEADDPYDAARALVLQGHARVLARDSDAGVGEMEEGLAVLTAAGSTRWQARGLDLLGRARQDRGEREAARACFQKAAELYAGISPADAERLRALADAL
ncbi:tetratricopeptide repeat protein [Streptomyces sp. NPDC088124]|uniref:tetratricopeptide repeat protein n=1 Tax=Streptomyces sp. NPDC088124 TaxID=3154654 RepID=UPI00341E1C63